jgi:hypothetical protein
MRLLHIEIQMIVMAGRRLFSGLTPKILNAVRASESITPMLLSLSFLGAGLPHGKTGALMECRRM